MLLTPNFLIGPNRSIAFSNSFLSLLTTVHMQNATQTSNKHLLTSSKTSSAFFFLHKNLRRHSSEFRPPSGLIAPQVRRKHSKICLQDVPRDLCLGLQSSVFRSQGSTKMTLEMTHKTQCYPPLPQRFLRAIMLSFFPQPRQSDCDVSQPYRKASAMNSASHNVRLRMIPQIADAIAMMPCACGSSHDNPLQIWKAITTILADRKRRP